jgi:hypothetical protein
LYPALHVQFQIDADATGDALVLTHDVHAVMPVLSAYVFAGQSMHVEFPYTDLYLPSAHCTQSGPNAPVYPGLQKHAVSAVAPESEYEFAGHDGHSQFPVRFLKLPGAHCSHWLAVAPVYPGMHPQSWILPLPGGANEYSGHGEQTGLPSGEYSVALQLKHVSLLIAPMFSEYMPVVQLEHARCANRGLYVPCGHSAHSSPACRKPTLHWQ